MKKQLDIKKLVLLNLPYLLMGLFATNLGEGWRMATGADASAKMLSFFSTLPVALASWWPSLHPLDLLVGLCCCGGLRLSPCYNSSIGKTRIKMQTFRIIAKTLPMKMRLPSSFRRQSDSLSLRNLFALSSIRRCCMRPQFFFFSPLSTRGCAMI